MGDCYLEAKLRPGCEFHFLSCKLIIAREQTDRVTAAALPRTTEAMLFLLFLLGCYVVSADLKTLRQLEAAQSFHLLLLS